MSVSKHLSLITASGVLQSRPLPPFLVTKYSSSHASEIFGGRAGKDQGFSERVVLDQSQTDIANRVLNELETLSLFADRTLVELRLSKTTLDQSLRAVLEQWIQNSPNDKRLLISGPKLGKSESSATWYKLLERSKHFD